MKHLNIEIKARCTDPDRVRRELKGLQSDFRGVDHQIDTYFNCNNGRMKLREGNIEHALIHYTRPDQDDPKRSDVILYHPHPDGELKELLTRGLGVLVVVDKLREIHYVDNVKVHVDEVFELGSFVEIEAIDDNGRFSEDDLRGQCDYYMQLFGVQAEDLIEVSYSDMLLARNAD